MDELSQLNSVENERLQFEIKKHQDKVREKEEEIRHLKEKHSKALAIWEEKANHLKKDLTVKDEEMSRLKTEYKITLEEHISVASERLVDFHNKFYYYFVQCCVPSLANTVNILVVRQC